MGEGLELVRGKGKGASAGERGGLELVRGRESWLELMRGDGGG